MPATQTLSACLLSAATLAAGWLAPPALAQDADGFEPSGPWTRTVTGEDDTVRLDIATRFLVPIDGEGPTIALVGAVHIADASYYTVLQTLLDSQDLVLYEGVGGPGEGDIAPGSDEDMVRRTDRRLQFLCAMARRFTEAQGVPPAGLEGLLEAEPGVFDQVLTRKLRVAALDAWGNPVRVVQDLEGAGFSAASYGADGEPGGEGVDADIQHDTGLLDADAEDSLYATIAELFGLSFQGERILTDQPAWINSDLAWDEVAAELDRDDPQTRALLEGLLGGDDPQMRMLMEGVEQFLTASPLMRAMAKMMLVRTLGEADPAAGAGAALGEGFDRVIIDLRNQAVIDDLKHLLDGGTDAGSIAVFYGAGHMADMEERAYEQIGYKVVGGMWLAAVTLDLQREGLSEREINLIRRQLGE